MALDAKYEADIFSKYSMSVNALYWEDYVESIAQDNGWIDKTVVSLRYRSKLKGLKSGITKQILRKMLLESGGRCAVTGILFNKTKAGKKSPFFHSVDRIDCKKGYTEANCRIVCFGVNVALLNWGEEVFKDLAIGYVMNRYASFVLADHMNRR